MISSGSRLRSVDRNLTEFFVAYSLINPCPYRIQHFSRSEKVKASRKTSFYSSFLLSFEAWPFSSCVFFPTKCNQIAVPVTYLSSFEKVLYSVFCVGCCSVSVVKKSKRSFSKRVKTRNVPFLSARPLPTDPQQIPTLQSSLRSSAGQRNAPGVVILFMRQRK